MKLRVRAIAALMTFAMITSVITGCGSKKSEPAATDTKQQSNVPSYLNTTGFPIVKEPITLKIFISAFDSVDDASKLPVLQEYEKKTGIKVNWQTVPSSNAKEKIKLALASQDLPDAFMKTGLSNSDQLSFGSQGMLINLNDGLLQKYGPNTKAFLDKYTEVKKAQTFDNGAIYSLPSANDSDVVRLARKMFINTTWLKKVGKEMPTTTDQLYDVLKAFKEKDPNGNGKADEIPMSSDGLSNITNALKGAFGIGNRGIIQSNLDMDESTGKMRYIPVSTQYRDFLDYFRKLYTEGLLDREIFTIKGAQFSAKSIEGVIGVTAGPNTAALGQNHVAEFDGLKTALKGPKGDQLWSPLRPHANGTGAFIITSANKYPEATMRWVDYFMSDEGTLFFHFGIEGQTCVKKADGSYDWSDNVYKSVTGNTTFDTVTSKISPYVGGSCPAVIKDKYYGGREMEAVSAQASKNMMPYAPKEVWPDFTYTQSENEKLVTLKTDIDSYVSKMQAEFITGKTPLSQWDSYVEQIKKMGLDDMMKINESAYARYKK